MRIQIPPRRLLLGLPAVLPDHHTLTGSRRKMPSKRPHSSKPASAPAPDGQPKPKLKPHKTPNASPNPNPSKPPKSPKKPTSPPPDPASEADAASRKSQRKRKARELLSDSDADAGAKSAQLRWADEDTLALLKAVIDFRAKNGKVPISTDIAALFRSVKPSLHSGITQEQVYNKLRNLRRKFARTAVNGPGPTPYDKEIHELSSEVWADEEKLMTSTMTTKKKAGVQEENGGLVVETEDGGKEEGLREKEDYPCLAHELVEYWKMNGLSMEALESGLKLVDAAKAKALEEKWVQHLRGDLKLQVKRADLNKEICGLLLAAPKEGGSS